MKNYLYKLEFTGKVRFGKISGGMDRADFTAGADTLFSALYTEGIRALGAGFRSRLLSYAESGRLAFSDLMPYQGETLYLPRPSVHINREYTSERKPGLAKKIKKMRYVSAEKLHSFFQVKGLQEIGGEVGYTGAAGVLNYRNAVNPSSDTDIYLVSSYAFASDSGLYFIAAVEDDMLEEFSAAVEVLADTGIGGERSLGYGRFRYDDPIELHETDADSAFITESEKAIIRGLKQQGPYYMTLSSVIPRSDEIGLLKDSAFYTLSKASGFIYSDNYSDTQRKKKQVCRINSGSVFTKPIKGMIADLSDGGSHPVYRYGKAFMIGVDIHE